jgi:hypothetical protein
MTLTLVCGAQRALNQLLGPHSTPALQSSAVGGGQHNKEDKQFWGAIMFVVARVLSWGGGRNNVSGILNLYASKLDLQSQSASWP